MRCRTFLQLTKPCKVMMRGGTSYALCKSKVQHTLDKESFDCQVKTTALEIPRSKCQQLLKGLSKYLFNRPRKRNVEKSRDRDRRLLLLSEKININDIATLAIDEDLSLQSLLESKEVVIAPYLVTLGYDDLSASEVLRQILPQTVSEIPASFETVGHIAHVNLRADLLPYKYDIGQVLLDKNPVIKTVVNKVGTITSEYRVFDMEILAGEPSTVTQVKQNGCTFKLDFRRVYWNSRLDDEHKRLNRIYFKEDDIILDAMAGIGPFAIPAAKKGCTVFANDLNPDSFLWLNENVKCNKVKVGTFNMDAREFLVQSMNGIITGAVSKKNGPLFHHVVMNLPASAMEFLDCVRGQFESNQWLGKELPIFHVYSFLDGGMNFDDLQSQIETHLGGNLDEVPEIHVVRDVAPNKVMVCSSFKIPATVAFDTSKRIKRK